MEYHVSSVLTPVKCIDSRVISLVPSRLGDRPLAQQGKQGSAATMTNDQEKQSAMPDAVRVESGGCTVYAALRRIIIEYIILYYITILLYL